MTGTPAMLQESRGSAHREAMPRNERLTDRPFGLDLYRSRESRRRHRVLMSARHVAELFACHGDRGARLH
ncbi:hypothetical protein [Bradyrhizobium sp.]|uniref:hypothetical protein n=1 Tax=Bradyrhizobium sp. TaxID=376 RepID=UPI003C788DE7